MNAMDNIIKMLGPGIGENKEHKFVDTEIANEMISKLPASVWNSKTKFLDPACKSGIFLYKIYKKLMEALEKEAGFEDKEKRREHILKNQLYGVCPNGQCEQFSIRTAVGYLTDEYNIKWLDDYENKITDKEAIKELFGGNINFDVIIGYPQFDFKEVAEEFADIVCLYVD